MADGQNYEDLIAEWLYENPGKTRADAEQALVGGGLMRPVTGGTMSPSAMPSVPSMLGYGYGKVAGTVAGTAPWFTQGLTQPPVVGGGKPWPTDLATEEEVRDAIEALVPDWSPADKARVLELIRTRQASDVLTAVNYITTQKEKATAAQEKTAQAKRTTFEEYRAKYASRFATLGAENAMKALNEAYTRYMSGDYGEAAAADVTAKDYGITNVPPEVEEEKTGVSPTYATTKGGEDWYSLFNPMRGNVPDPTRKPVPPEIQQQIMDYYEANRARGISASDAIIQYFPDYIQKEPEPAKLDKTSKYLGTGTDTATGQIYDEYGYLDETGNKVVTGRVNFRKPATTDFDWQATGKQTGTWYKPETPREPSAFETQLQRGTPSWLRNFMSQQELQKVSQDTASWQNWYVQATQTNPALAVGRAESPTGGGYNPQWTEAAYEALTQNLGTIGGTPPTPETFAQQVAGTGIINTLNQYYRNTPFSGGTTPAPPATPYPTGQPWWAKQYNMSQQDYNRLTPEEQQDYMNYARSWWNPTKGKISGVSGLNAFYQRK